jgi:uncharacterized protein (DUF302 family)
MSDQHTDERPMTKVSNFPMRRLTTPVPDVRGFQRRYEAAVPDAPMDKVDALVQRGAPWSEMIALLDASAPHGFIFYFKSDVHPLFAAAGDAADAIFYLMGNHILAELMFRHDPRVMLYAPLRTIIWEDAAGAAWFTVDQPSRQFGSFGVPEITELGIELDGKLAALLEALDVEAPPELRHR